MYRPSPIRNARSKGFKTKNVLQVCLLLAVCFWLIFQVKRSHDKKKEFDNTKISLSTSKQINDESVKLGRKDLQPKLEKDVEMHEEQDEEKMDEEKDDGGGGGGGDDEIDENEQEKSDVDVDREESEVIDEESQTVDDHEENGASTHTHEGREEHYKADDASSAVVTQLSTENGTLEEISNTEKVDNETSLIHPHENGPPSNTIITTSEALNAIVTNETEAPSNTSDVLEDLESNESNNSDGLKQEDESDENEGENLEGKEEILDPEEVENETHLEEKEVRMDLDTLPEIETEGGNSEIDDSAVERR